MNGHKQGCRCPVCRSERGERESKKPFTLRLSQKMLDKLKDKADKQGVTVTAIIEKAIESL
ncbi:MAG: ribbon-helix-helix protein, CopG family [Candidatus Eremiobacteraeota bacterium]|nr:ribbon-helix-helix protein, CopG family [Candidatus Eremiobacteraeota bacterium]